MASAIIDEIEGSGKFKIGQDGMAGTRIARCLWENWPAAIYELMGTPLVYGGTIVIVGRQHWPGIPILQVDSIDVEGQGRMKKTTWGQGPGYKYGKLTINYKTQIDEDDENPDGGEPGTYLIESLDYSVEIAVIPVLVVDDVDPEKAEKPADDVYYPGGVVPKDDPDVIANAEKRKKTVKRHVRIPTITYQTTLPRVPNLPYEAIRTACGRVNKTQIFGGAPGTVLFDGPQAERESAFFTARFWRVQYKFLYQPFGWNNTLHPDSLKWVPAKGNGSENDPYLGYELKNLFPAPYRVRS